MNDLEKEILSLIIESRKIKFKDNSSTSSLGTFGKISPELLAWHKKCEKVIIDNSGVFSSTWNEFEIIDIEMVVGEFSGKLAKFKRLVTDVLKSLVMETKDNIEPDIETKKVSSQQNIFIVHGHNEGIKNQVARFIEQIDFNPIILHEQASSGKTIIEKIEAYSNVAFGIVLYTACDEGREVNSDAILTKRARQNVVFEHGYLIGKIGRNNVCALVERDIEIPNDISGVVYVQIDKAEAWKLSLVKEMKNSGLKIDMNLML